MDGWCPFEVVITFMTHPRSARRHEGHKTSRLHHTHLVSVRLRRRGHFHLVRDVSGGCPSISTCPCDTLSEIQLDWPVLQESSCPLRLITANPLSSKGTQPSCDSRHRYGHGRDAQSVIKLQLPPVYPCQSDVSKLPILVQRWPN